MGRRNANTSIEECLTPKQRAFFKYIALGFSKVEAGKKAGYKQRTSANSTLHLHTQAFREAFSAVGLSIGEIAEKVKEGMSAMRVISAVDTGKQANGATTDFIEVPDWNARHKYIDTAIELQGLYAPDKMEFTGLGGGPIEVNYNRKEMIHILYEIVGVERGKDVVAQANK